MSNLKHLLFDCDGVLVDTEFVAAVKMTKALNDLGVDLSVDYYLRELSGGTFSSIVHRYLNNSLTDSEVLILVNRVENQVAKEVKIVDGVSELLIHLTVPKSVVSNSSIRIVRHSLDTTGIASQFSKEIFSSELVARPKPSPDIYQLAIDNLDYKTSEILVIEDSLSGVEAARLAGLAVIGFTGASHILPGHEEKLLSLGAAHVASSMEEVGFIIAQTQTS